MRASMYVQLECMDFIFWGGGGGAPQQFPPKKNWQKKI